MSKIVTFSEFKTAAADWRKINRGECALAEPGQTLEFFWQTPRVSDVAVLTEILNETQNADGDLTGRGLAAAADAYASFLSNVLCDAAGNQVYSDSDDLQKNGGFENPGTFEIYMNIVKLIADNIALAKKKPRRKESQRQTKSIAK